MGHFVLDNNSFYFFQASERPGCQNPLNRLAKHTHVTGPVYYDTAHGPDFLPAVAISALKKRHAPKT